MKRRSFLTTAIATVSIPNAHSKKARAIKKSLKYGMIAGGTTILEKFRIAKDAGFDGVEFDVPTEMSKAELIAAREETGLLIPGLVCPGPGQAMTSSNPDTRTKAVSDFTRALHDCRDYGGTTVLLYPGIVNKQTSHAQAFARLVECVRQLVPVAKETGVKIALENVWNHIFLTPLEATAFLDEIAAPAQVGWYLDIGNLIAFGWPEHWIHQLGGERIFKVDIKEYSRKLQREQGSYKGFHVPLLEGDCDWPTVMKSLDEVNYQGGWFAAEVHGGNATRLAEISTKLDQIIAL